MRSTIAAPARPGQHVPPEVVGAERVDGARWLKDLVEVVGEGIVRAHSRADHPRDQQDQQHRPADRQTGMEASAGGRRDRDVRGEGAHPMRTRGSNKG
jgi:hypothetical protein